MARTGRILVVDDEANARTALAELLRDEGFEVETAADAFKALGKYEAFAPHVVVTDLKMPGMDGIELVKKLRAMRRPARGDRDDRVRRGRDRGRGDARRRRGLPDQAAQLRRAAGRARQGAREPGDCAARPRSCARACAIAWRPSNMVGSSPPMQRVFEIIDQVAPSRATVLITGESGTGKELVANAIHQRSPRANGPFIKLHCAALAETLLESELFGHEKGSFTGATTRKDGRFSLADGGTLFLDEIGEISPALQVKLLRFLQEHEFERVGGTQTIHVDVRVIAATNRDLREEVARGRFREDLFYRLNVVTIEMPPLRERRVRHPGARAVLPRPLREGRTARRSRRSRRRRSSMLVGYDWPGNVRELENAIERAVVLATGTEIEARHLPPSVRPVGPTGDAADPGRDDGGDRALRDPRDAEGRRRLDLEGRRDARHQRAHDPVSTPRVPGRAALGRRRRSAQGTQPWRERQECDQHPRRDLRVRRLGRR